MKPMLLPSPSLMAEARRRCIWSTPWARRRPGIVAHVHVEEGARRGGQERRWVGEGRAPNCRCTPVERRRAMAQTRAWARPEQARSMDHARGARSKDPMRMALKAAREPMMQKPPQDSTRKPRILAWVGGRWGFCPCSWDWDASRVAVEAQASPVEEPPEEPLEQRRGDPSYGRDAGYWPCATGSAPPFAAWSGPRRGWAEDGEAGSALPAGQTDRQDRPSEREEGIDRRPPRQAHATHRRWP